MRLVDLLISMLEAHAQALQRLAALFGEDRLLEVLENAGESEAPAPEEPDPEWFEAPRSPLPQSSMYAELEGAVRELKLPAVFEFHLWAYPSYRALIESPYDLGSRIRGASGTSTHPIVERAISDAENWVKRLPIPPAISLQAERAAQIPWIKFRTNVLKKMGVRPLGAI